MEARGEIDTLRISTAGSVDDGKSTLIGRLLFDVAGILEDQIAQLEGATRRHGHVAAGEVIDFSLLTDGLIAEREQGITIDVAYRYFTSATRRFILADTPGHEQYTRNMVTGASTADLAIILTDVKRGLTAQSHRHAVIASLLGIREVVVAVNKMDLVAYAEGAFAAMREEFAPFLARLGFSRVDFVPVSALNGVMLVHRGSTMLWYDGPTVFERLVESAANQRGSGGLRFAVQRVARARFGTNADLRGLQGQMLGGVLAVGETVMIAPARHMARVAYIYRSTQPVEQCVRGDAVTVVLDGQHDVARGDALVGMDAEPMIATRWQASLCWLDAESMLPGRRYWLKHTTRTTRAMVEGDATLINVCDLHESSTSGLKVNDVARVTISTQHPLVADRYLDNRDTGSFILIDDATHRTVAAGMLVGALDERLR